MTISKSPFFTQSIIARPADIRSIADDDNDDKGKIISIASYHDVASNSTKKNFVATVPADAFKD